MPFDKFSDIDSINEERHKAVTKSIRIVTVEELKKVAEEIFHSPDDPWKATLLQFVAENPSATFYHADAGQGVIFFYLPERDKGLWWLRGSGMGTLSERARQLMKGAIRQCA